MELVYRVLADLVVTIHFAYVAFVIVGLLLTLAGAVLKWRWVRNFWFRTAHLAMIAVVVIEAWCGIVCPLTTWENELRTMAGQATYRGGFLANVLHDAMFFEAEPWELGTGEFSVSAWMYTENGLKDAPGDLVSKFDHAKRQGFSLSINAGNPGYNAPSNVRHLFFGIDSGTTGQWTDCGRPGGKTHNQ